MRVRGGNTECNKMLVPLLLIKLGLQGKNIKGFLRKREVIFYFCVVLGVQIQVPFFMLGSFTVPLYTYMLICMESRFSRYLFLAAVAKSYIGKSV